MFAPVSAGCQAYSSTSPPRPPHHITFMYYYFYGGGTPILHHSRGSSACRVREQQGQESNLHMRFWRPPLYRIELPCCEAPLFFKRAGSLSTELIHHIACLSAADGGDLNPACGDASIPPGSGRSMNAGGAPARPRENHSRPFALSRAAFISCAVGNDYGHPHKETISRLSDAGVTVYRTDLDGTVIIFSDGMHVERKAA